MPLVSICLPVYNGEEFLGEAIESVLNQSFTDLELLIGDDASTDNSEAIARKYAEKDKRIVYWKNSQNKGLFGNYNECMNRATGTYIKPFAQDDIFDTKLIERMVSGFKADPDIALVACARRIVDDNGLELSQEFEYPSTTILDGNDKVRDDLIKVTNGIGEPSTVMFPRAYLGAGFDVRLHHLGDIEYWHRLILDKKFLYISEILCSFRRHAKSTTNRNAREMRYGLDMLLLGQKYKQFLEARGITENDFADICVTNIASHTKFLADRHGVVLADLMQGKPQTLEEAVADLDGFKEIAYRSLILNGRLMEELTAIKQEWEMERNALEDTIARLMKSKWWKMTGPLRAAVISLRSKRNR
ncbi:MAG: glycosyltransferase [Candidatus Obscuribacterales bacterium]|nr:glycosyltransferase [Candidatus Obscuribacterales bacterium]